MKLNKLFVVSVFLITQSALAGNLLGSNAKPSTVDKGHNQVSDNKKRDIQDQGVERQLAELDIKETYTEFERDDENPCDQLFENNEYVVNDEVRDCRIRIAKSRPGNIQACRASANGQNDDYNNCLADRGVSSLAIEKHREYLEDLAEREAEIAENAAERAQNQPAVPENFNYKKDNSIARTFHFWEILEQHQVPILYGKNKNPSMRVISYSHKNDGSLDYDDNSKGIEVLNDPKKTCQMLRDDKDNFFEDVVVQAGRPLALVGFPDTTPFRQDLRHPDFNAGKPYQQISETMGIGKDGEYIKARQGETEGWLNKKEIFYLHYLKITCVRRLQNNEEANEDAWKAETRYYDRSFQALFDFRDEQLNGGQGEDQDRVLAKPIFLPNGTIIYSSESQDKTSDDDYYTPTSNNKFTSGVSAD